MNNVINQELLCVLKLCVTNIKTNIIVHAESVAKLQNMTHKQTKELVEIWLTESKILNLANSIIQKVGG